MSVVALTDDKWVDNFLARFDIDGVERETHGVARRISLSGVRHIVLARRLIVQLGVPASAAVSLAGQALSAPTGVVQLAREIELHIDRAALFSDIDQRLADAVESVVPARRGRPRKRAASP